MPLQFIFNNPTSTLALAISILSFMLFLLEFRRNRSESFKKEQQSLEKAEDSSYKLLHDAIKKSQAILGQAELEEIKVVANSKLQTEKLEKALQNELSQVTTTATQNLEQSVKNLEANITVAHNEYQKYLQELKVKVESAQASNEEIIKTQVNQLFEKFEQNLTDFLTQTEQKTITSIELELKAARQLIDTYKQQQLQIVDENIIAILEKTLSLVVAKKLSLKDQSEMVFEALEKAKVEKFIV